VSGGRTESIGKNTHAEVQGSSVLQVGGDAKEDVGGSQTVQVGKTLTISAGDELSITVGSATFLMKKDGTITLNGKDITLKGSGKIGIQAASAVVVKGSTVNLN